MDKSKLSVDQLAQVELWQQGHDQIEKLEDVAAMAQKMVGLLEDGNKGSEKQNTNLGALMMDMREALQALKNKDDPDFPDYAKPVVESVKKLESTMVKAFSDIDFKPEYRPEINVAGPIVHAPDLKGVEKLLKEDLPAAFEEAVQGIQFPAMPDDADFKTELIEWLESIDKGVHTHTPAPSTLKVTNADGSVVGRQGILPFIYDRLDFSNADGNGNYQTGLVKLSGSTIATLSMTFDASNNVTSIVRS